MDEKKREDIVKAINFSKRGKGVFFYSELLESRVYLSPTSMDKDEILKKTTGTTVMLPNEYLYIKWYPEIGGKLFNLKKKFGGTITCSEIDKQIKQVKRELMGGAV